MGYTRYCFKRQLKLGCFYQLLTTAQLLRGRLKKKISAVKHNLLC